MMFTDWLTLLFIYLRLTHHIEWSWWLILLPLYGQIFGKAIIEKYKEDKAKKP